MPREIHIHVEEPSMEAFLRELLGKRLAGLTCWRAIDYGSKQQLLSRLPLRLQGYARTPRAHRPLSLVLVDRDDDDCEVLKSELDAACVAANLPTTSSASSASEVEVINRIVIEELEAWFFGAPNELEAGWPGLGRVSRQAAYRDPDAIRGGTHDALLREMQRAGHHRGLTRLPKIDTARIMGGLLNPATNVSRSFQHFWNSLNALAANV